MIINKTNRVVAFISFFNFSRTIVGSFFVIYPLTLGVSEKEVGLLISLLIFMILILDIPTSYVFDKISYSLSLKLSVFFGFLCFTTIFFAENFNHFVLAQFFNALSICLNSGASKSLLYDASIEEGISFKTLNGKLEKISHTFMLVASLVGGYLYYLFEKLDFLFLISAIILFILWLLSGILLNFEKSRKIKVKDEREYTLGFLLKSISSGNILLNVIFLILNSLLFLTFIQVWQPTLYKIISSAEEITVFPLYFSGLMISQILASYMYENNYLNKLLLTITNIAFFALILILMFIDNALLEKFIFFSILCVTFFNIRFISLDIENNILSNSSSELKSTIFSIISTVSMIMSIALIYVYMYFLKDNYTSFLYLTTFTIIYNFIYILRFFKK